MKGRKRGKERHTLYIYTRAHKEEQKGKGEGRLEQIQSIRILPKLHMDSSGRRKVGIFAFWGLCKLNCVMLYSHSISSVGERPAPRVGTTRPAERKITTI